MASSLHERLKIRVDELVSSRKTTENTWQQIADNLLGRRDFTVTRTPGQNRMDVIYDDTAKVSGSLLAGAIHSLLTNPAARWFALRFEDPNLNDIRDASVWLNAVEKRLYAAIGAPKANFHAQLSESYIDLIYFGMAAMFIDDVPGSGIQFSARPLSEIFVAEDPSGRIDTIVRKFKLTARQAFTIWGSEAKAASASMRAGRTEDKHQYAHIIMPNDDVSLGKIDANGMPFASFHLSMEDNGILSTGGFHEIPIVTPRWEKDAGEVYGRGPGWNALSNQKMLNEMQKVTLKAGQKHVDPPYMVDSEGVLPSDIRFHPNSIIPINSVMSNMNPPIQPLPLGGNFSIGSAMIADARAAVQNGFHHQLIETIRDPRMTATQVMELSAQMQRHLAPILGRMQTEMLEPIIERVFAIEARAGRLPPAPQSIENMEIKIDYVSPIARAQQTSDARAMIDYAGFISNMAQVDDRIVDLVDFDEWGRELADAMGVPVKIMRDARQIEQIRNARNQAAAEEQQQEQISAATSQVADLARVARAA